MNIHRSSQLVALVMALLAIVLFLLGLLWLLFHERGAGTYVTLAGSHVSARPLGAIAIGAAVVVGLIALLMWRKGHLAED
jgi:hypothetical protein